jgi:hypothetical protein
MAAERLRDGVLGTNQFEKGVRGTNKVERGD